MLASIFTFMYFPFFLFFKAPIEDPTPRRGQGRDGQLERRPTGWSNYEATGASPRRKQSCLLQAYEGKASAEEEVLIVTDRVRELPTEISKEALGLSARNVELHAEVERLRGELARRE
ncbi:hypothetical protein ACSQ67_025546 [Phaseolus vulgaris]